MAKTASKIALLAALVYFVQGFLGISAIALPLYLRSLGWSISKISAVSAFVAFPWVLKIVYGLLSDSIPIFGYRRKSYLIVCSFFSAAGWLGLVLLPPETKWIFFAMSISNMGYAATDVVTDGLIVEHSKGVLSSFFQSIAWGSRSFGSFLAGMIGGVLAAQMHPKGVFLLTMLLPLPVAIFAMFVDEPKREITPLKLLHVPVIKCVRLLQVGTMRWFAAILIVISSGSSFGMPFFFYMRETLHFSEHFLGYLVSAGWGGAMIGSILYARWLKKIDMQKILRFAIFVNSINILSALFIQGKAVALAIIFVGGVMGCICLLSIMTAAAILTHKSDIEGTFFAVLMGIYNLSQISFGYVGSKVYEFIGLQTLIILSGAMGFLGLLFVRKVDFNKKKYETV